MGEAVASHAARVLERIGTRAPADRALRDYLAERSRLGAGERRMVARAVFAYFRWIGWLERGDSSERQVHEALVLQDRFEKAPSSVKPQALAARAVPGWLAGEMGLTPEFLRQIQREPVLWIRAKADRAEAAARTLGACAPAVLPESWVRPMKLAAFRYSGGSDLHRTVGFRSGDLEIQDLASQLVGLACAARPGETWWDACCGEGGKALHLCDLMENRGLIWATDRSVRRLSVLKDRAARAGMFNYRATVWNGAGPAPFRTLCDGVLVDAPCSGVGTWQRNPHARWTTGPGDVRELSGIQRSLLDRASGSVKPGGRLVYSVCTLTRSETAEVADDFEGSHPDFEPAPLPLLPTGAPDALRLTLRPEAIEANGMFIASWRRR